MPARWAPWLSGGGKPRPYILFVCAVILLGCKTSDPGGLAGKLMAISEEARKELGAKVPPALICVLPTVLAVRAGVPFFFGGTALLIVVGVGLDTIAQIEAHLVSRQYEGFVQGTRIRGRLGR